MSNWLYIFFLLIFFFVNASLTLLNKPFSILVLGDCIFLYAQMLVDVWVTEFTFLSHTIEGLNTS